MLGQPLSRRERWLGAACALAVLVIWTSFILIARVSARHALSAFDIAFLRFLFSGLVVLPFAWRRRAALRAGLGGAEAWKRGAALAAVAGIMYLLYYGVVDFFMGFVAGIKAFTAAVLGGIGSLPGAMLGGLAIGLIETFWSAYFTIEYKDVAAFSILIIVLIFLPTGILGRPEVEKV